MLCKTWVRTLVLALVGLLVGAQGVSTAELVFRVERVTGDLWAKGMIHSSTGFRFPDDSIQTTAANGNGWSLTGNAGTAPATNFLGTTDDVAFEIRVNNVRALRIEPHAMSPNIIGGYSGNSVGAGVRGATIGGGGRDGDINQITANFGTVGGGFDNTASGLRATVAGGNSNTASGNRATVAGGEDNTASGNNATVAGGWDNTASGEIATVAGGFDNTASGYRATVAGGSSNTASGSWATVGGGIHNTASGSYATVAGGRDNTAAGDYSFAAGWGAKANHAGTFVWADATDFHPFGTIQPNQFMVRASGGYQLFSSFDNSSGVILSTGSGSWSSVSDRNVKANFAGVDTVQLLDALAGMPVSTWNLQAQPEEIRHIGPMAQDFNASFGYLFGEVESELHINTMDAVGVSLAASQGLYTLVKEQAEQIAQQAEEIEDLRARLEALEKLVQGGE